MRVKHRQLLVTFSTTTAAMAMENKAIAQQLSGRIIPLPTEISAGCGLAWKAELAEREKIMDFLRENHLSWEMIYELELY